MLGAQFDDTIAYSDHPMDVHNAKTSQQTLTQLHTVGPIPYRAMVTGEIRNLITSGRCISADRMAHATMRVMATAMAVGEAAGVAASISCKDGVSVADVPAAELRDILRSQGGIVD